LLAWDGSKSFYYSPEAIGIRNETVQFAQLLNELANSKYLRDQAWEDMKGSFLEYIDETAALTPQAQYNQGKIIFEVLGLFIGVAEIRALLKGGKVTYGIAGSLKNISKQLSKFFFDLRNIGVKVVKDGDNYKILTEAGDKIADIKNGKLLPDKYGDGTPVGEPIDGYQLVDDAGDMAMKRTPDVSAYNADDLTKLTEHPSAHTLERHGHDVTNEALIKRVEEGIAPDGANAPISNYASRFESPKMVKEALESIKPGSSAFDAKVWDNDRFVWVVEHPGNFGVGFGNDVNNGLVQMTKVTAYYDEVSPGIFELISMFPNK
jgi:hypothetical protein